MAVFHNHISKVQRSNGQNAIAASAYIGARALEMLDGTTADYSKKKGVCGNRIIAPSFCEKKKDVSAQWLWQEAEKAEKRKNSTVARRADLALPTEFTEEECFAVGYQYAQDIADRYNVVVDINFHDLSTNNPHIDMMWTTRVFDGESLKEKTRILDDKVTGPKEVHWLREQWANKVNEVLITYATTIDHRSYKEQGSEKLATKHLGRKISALEKAGVETEIGNYNRQVSEYNKLIEEKEKLDTEIVQLEKEIQENQNDKFRDITDGKSTIETRGSEFESRGSTDERSDKSVLESPSLISANATADRGIYAEYSETNQSAAGTTERYFTRDIQLIRPSFDWANKATSREHGTILSRTSIDSSTPKRDSMTNKKELTEQEVRSRYITPAIQKAGWSINQIRENYAITKGRIIARGGTPTRENAKFADYVLFYKSHIPLVVVEAKDNKHSVTDGMQQALDYAESLQVPFVFTSNGDGFTFHNRNYTEGDKEVFISLDDFPSPEELWNSYMY